MAYIRGRFRDGLLQDDDDPVDPFDFIGDRQVTIWVDALAAPNIPLQADATAVVLVGQAARNAVTNVNGNWWVLIEDGT